MKSRETKARDLAALTESLQNSKSAMVVSFTKLSVNKDQEFRNSVREAGANYQVVKNTLARIAVKGTDFEQASEHFKGVTAIAWTDNDPVVLTKAISKFMKENADVYTFKTGVVDGSLIDLSQLNVIANLPSKDELISKLLYVLNAQAQRLVTVISAVPRDLAVVIKQIGDKAPAAAAAPPADAASDAGTSIATETQEEAKANDPDDAGEAALEVAGVATESSEEATAAAPDDAAEAALVTETKPADEAVPDAPETEAPAEEKE
jgi:large subunit ribosomal protein L10